MFCWEILGVLYFSPFHSFCSEFVVLSRINFQEHLSSIGDLNLWSCYVNFQSDTGKEICKSPFQLEKGLGFHDISNLLTKPPFACLKARKVWSKTSISQRKLQLHFPRLCCFSDKGVLHSSSVLRTKLPL